MTEQYRRINIAVRGIVQGVGFRPFIHRLVSELSLTGWIRNTSAGAEIEVEGERGNTDLFITRLQSEKPRLAFIESVTVRECGSLLHEPEFRIIMSEVLNERNTLISPDICTCEDCQRELFDESDRRYRYPFINCTNCGPRFTIIKDVPYDRCNTTMGVFEMCEDCHREYTDIEDRRYHAQPDCCSDCGPHLFFLDAEGNEVSGDPISTAQQYLRDGKIVAIKGLGGFHLACRADDPELVTLLRRRKQRDAKPFALMCADTEEASKICEVSEAEKELLESIQRPIVLLKKKKPGNVSDNAYVGVMLPYTPVHFLLFHDDLKTLIMTSANLSDLPIIYRNEEALQSLRGIADGYLMHNRDIHVRCDDSVLWTVDEKPYFVRRSRGYVPYPVTIREPAEEQILACGAEQKASFSLVKGSHVFTSQHIGDLKNFETLENYENQIGHFENLFDIHPAKIVCDLHPDYLSTEYAVNRSEKENLPLIRVQHHHAHMASCMADNDLTGKTIGVIWDGTGFGTDGTIWGGEFLYGDYSGFERRGSIETFRLPGGDRATKEIWRTGLSLAYTFAPDEFDRLQQYTGAQKEQVRVMLDNGLNSPVCSSMGRLFDGVASLCGICEESGYEGQAAVLLEASAEDCDNIYPYRIEHRDGRDRFCMNGLISTVIQDSRNGVSAGIISAKFMNTLVDAAYEMCARIRRDTGTEQVVLSGGTFQNLYMLKRLMKKLEDGGFRAYHHVRVSANDEGISLGQIMIGKHMKEV